VSFKLFIYYSGLCAAWAALIGWGLGWWLAPEGSGDAFRAAIQGLILGGMIALGIGVVENVWNLQDKFVRPPWFIIATAVVGPVALFGLWYLSKGSQAEAGTRALLVAILIVVVAVLFFLAVLTMLWNLGGKRLAWLGPAVLVGALAGLAGGLAGQALYQRTEAEGWAVFGWAFTGLLIGLALGAYDLIVSMMQGNPAGPALRKIRNGLIGGAVGGLLGSLLFYSVRQGLGTAFGKHPEDMLSTSAMGFTALGGCIGAMIGWAQVILREAWIKIEAGFRPGRELILSKQETSIGRSEGCDIGLFGAKGVEKVHARIVQRGGQFVLVDAGSPNGTYLNDKRIKTPSALHTGDLILIGNCALRFQERKRRKKTPAAREPEFKLE